MQSAGDTYLMAEVTSAPPQRLQLMLIEGALRFSLRSQALMQQGEDHEAGEANLRCQEIVAHLLAALRQDQEPVLVQSVAAVYSFVFRCLVTAYLQKDAQKLADAISVLQEERETWRAVCEQMEGQPSEAASFAENATPSDAHAPANDSTSREAEQSRQVPMPHLNLDEAPSHFGSSVNFEA